MFSETSEFQSLFEKGISILDWYFVTVCDTDGIHPFEIEHAHYVADKNSDCRYSHICPGTDKRSAYFALAFLSGLKTKPNPALIVTFEFRDYPKIMFEDLFSEEFSEVTTEAHNRTYLYKRDLYESETKNRANGPGLITELQYAFRESKTVEWAKQAFEHMRKFFLEAETRKPKDVNHVHIAAFSYYWLPILAAWHIQRHKSKKLDAEFQHQKRMGGFRFLRQAKGEVEFAGEIMLSGE